MTASIHLRLQLVVFGLVSAAFTNIYILQPVLPVLQSEFGADPVTVSFTVSAVILGITIANLPFGYLVDRLPIQPLVLGGGAAVIAGGLVCTMTGNLWVLIAARLGQGLFVPALTTCLAAHLAKTLPQSRLNVVMGTFVSATVVGGLGGRLLGGWIHVAFHWRYALAAAALLTLLAILVALWGLPRKLDREDSHPQDSGYWELMRRWELVRIFLCSAGGFAVFSSIFNYLPYRLANPPFGLTTQTITLFYLVYIAGIFMGPIAGQLSNRYGSGNTIMAGSLTLAMALILLLLPFHTAIILGLLFTSIGFFALHAAAVGLLNRKLSGGQGRANALYVLFYYLGGWLGITGTGLVYQQLGWRGLVMVCLLVLIIPVSAGLMERKGTFPESI